ncbi:hypothetical protein PTKIN_Ptkin18bG0018400 [Pterospermum kingtungense]
MSGQVRKLRYQKFSNLDANLGAPLRISNPGGCKISSTVVIQVDWENAFPRNLRIMRTRVWIDPEQNIHLSQDAGCARMMNQFAGYDSGTKELANSVEFVESLGTPPLTVPLCTTTLRP